MVDNPRAVPGDNSSAAAQAQAVTDQLKRDYAHLVADAEQLKKRSAAFPAEITNKEDLEKIATVVLDSRNLDDRAESHRKAEKAPHWEKGKAVDGFFNSLRQEINIIALDLHSRVNVFQRKLRAAEEKKRFQAEQEAREEAERLRLKAERARKPETKMMAQVDAAAAQYLADQAVQTGRAKPLQHRFQGSNAMVSEQQVGYARVTDYEKLPLDMLRAYINRDALDVAVRAFARTTGHKVPLLGAEIGFESNAIIK